MQYEGMRRASLQLPVYYKYCYRPLTIHNNAKKNNGTRILSTIPTIAITRVDLLILASIPKIIPVADIKSVKTGFLKINTRLTTKSISDIIAAINGHISFLMYLPIFLLLLSSFGGGYSIIIKVVCQSYYLH